MIPILSGNVASALGGAYEVANSCRFNSGDSAKMAKSSSGGTRTKWTMSMWFKRGTISVTQYLFSSYSGSNYCYVQINSDDNLRFLDYSSGNNCNKITTRKFRDPSAWYHMVVQVDTTDGTAGDRFKLWINGVRETDFGTSADFSSSFDTNMNVSGHSLEIGVNQQGNDNYWNGYIAETVLIDGSDLDATSFGEYDEDSPTIWKPKNVSGLTVGTNGFYLDFEDSSNLGNDAKGGTDFTETNLDATDQSTDTPTNNFCTMNPLVPTSNITFSEGNCKMVTSSSDTHGAGVGTFGLTAGRWYYEVKIASLVDNHTHGAVSELTSELYQNVTGIQNDTGVTSWINGDGGEVVVDGTATTNDYGLYTDGQIMGVALDIDNYNITYLRNGSALVSDFNMSTTRGTIFPLIKTGVNTTSEVNFGGCSAFRISSAQSDQNGYGNFEIAPPSGYLAICSKNLGSDGG